jgi:hypothetical protein
MIGGSTVLSLVLGALFALSASFGANSDDASHPSSYSSWWYTFCSMALPVLGVGACLAAIGTIVAMGIAFVRWSTKAPADGVRDDGGDVEMSPLVGGA